MRLMQVVFQLHSSFAVPLRHVEQQPFELTEAGWGEFEIGIQVRNWAATCAAIDC